MENKQIIIDNIDVSGCNFTLERDGKIKCECTHATGFGVICDCEKWHNCYFKQLEQVKQENKRLLEIINAKPLETVDIDSAFEIEKLKEQLQAKEQECKETKNCLLQVQNASISLNKQLDNLKKENEKISKGYAELTDIVSPYIDDFTGYNEKLGGFDIVLCVKELLQQVDQLKVELEQEKALKETYLTCYKAKHEDIEGALFKLKQTLADIKEITKNMNKECFYDDFSCDGCDMINGCTYQGKLSVLQKISECEVK